MRLPCFMNYRSAFSTLLGISLWKGLKIIYVPLLGAIFTAGSIACAQAVSVVGSISTVGGNGTQGYIGDNGPATSAEFRSPQGIAIDSAGDIYIADTNNQAIRRIDAVTGVITTVAGTGSYGYSGDGGSATSAQINSPQAVAVDSAGNLYIADTNNQRIRMVNPSGIMSTVAGNGSYGYSGDGGPATSAKLNSPQCVSVDNQGNIYITDTNGYRIRKVNTSGVISTVAGNGTQGFSGDGGAATSAEINTEQGVAADAAGNIYIADSFNQRIRKVNAAGTITTYAGTGTWGYSGDGGAATSAQINSPQGVAIDSLGNLYIADTNNQCIRMVTPSGIITTVAGTGSYGYNGDSIASTTALLNTPRRVAVDAAGNMYIADTNNQRVRFASSTIGSILLPSAAIAATRATYPLLLKINTASTSITGISVPISQGSNQEYVLTANSCALNTPLSSGTICTLTAAFTPAYAGPRLLPLQVASSAGNFDFGMVGSGSGPQVALTPGTISTMAGTGVAGSTGDGGAAASAELNTPYGARVDSAGNIYIADTNNNRIRKISTSGTITTVAGNGTAGYAGDAGAATNAELNNPTSAVVDSSGNIYIADRGNNRIREVAASTGLITTIAGTGTAGYNGDSIAASTAQINAPYSLTVDRNGNLFIADTGNHRIREINTQGVITTVSGTGTGGYNGDAILATLAELNQPYGVAVDSAGNLFITDHQNHRIRKVATSGYISTVAGTGTQGYTGDYGLATSAEIASPNGIVIFGTDNLYFSDYSNGVIRAITSAGQIFTVAGNGTSGYTGNGALATSAELNSAQDVGIDNAGALLISDSGNNVLRKINVLSTTFSYTTTSVGSLSTDSPRTATLENIGTAALTIAVPVSGLNPNLSSSFTLQNGSTCPQLSTTSSTATISAGASCSLLLGFLPAATGGLSGSASITDNALNVAGNVQTINLSGTGIAVATTSTIQVATPVIGDTAVTVTVAPVTGIAVPTGSVIFTVDGVAQSAIVLNGSSAASLLAAVANALTVGSHTISVAYTSNSSSFINSSGSLTFIVSAPAILATSINPVTPLYGQSATLTLTVVSNGAPVSGANATFQSQGQAYPCTTNALGVCSVAIAAGALPVGTDPITVTTAAMTTVLAGSENVSVNVSRSPVSLPLTSSVSVLSLGSQVIFTVTAIPATAGTPTGTVTFADNGSPLGTEPLSAGTTTLTTAALPTGINIITAEYSGDGNFLAAASTPTTETVNANFTIDGVGSSPNQPLAQTVHAGESASFNISLGAVNGFSGAVTMSASGLPPGAQVTFAPSTVMINSAGGAFTTMTIATAKQSSENRSFHWPSSETKSDGSSTLRYGLIFLPLPLLALRRFRKRLHGVPRNLLLLLLTVLSLGLFTFGLSSCGSGGSPFTGQSTAPTSSSYTITVIATNGNLHPSTSVVLTVQ